MAILQELEELGETIARKEKELNQTEGAEELLMKKLKEEFEVDSIEGAEAELKSAGVTLDRLENKIESDFAALKEDYDW